MLEKFNEKARRVLFFSRYEATRFGSPQIDPEHLLLGVLRESRGLFTRVLGLAEPEDLIRRQVESRWWPLRESVSMVVELPLSKSGKVVLAYTVEEAEKLGQVTIGPEHILLGVLREGNSEAVRVLKEKGIEYEWVRGRVVRWPPYHLGG